MKISLSAKIRVIPIILSFNAQIEGSADIQKAGRLHIRSRGRAVFIQIHRLFIDYIHTPVSRAGQLFR